MNNLTSIFNNSTTVVTDINQNWLKYFLGVEKIFFVIISILFIIFAFIIVKQVKSLSHRTSSSFNAVLIAISYINLIFSFLLTFLTILVL